MLQHPREQVIYRMNQILTTPHCLWLGFINQHLHYESELDSIADIHNRCYNSISIHFSLFIIKTKHIQNSPRLSLYHSDFLSHLDYSYSATIIVFSSSIPFCNVLNLLSLFLPYWTAQYIYHLLSSFLSQVHRNNILKPLQNRFSFSILNPLPKWFSF